MAQVALVSVGVAERPREVLPSREACTGSWAKQCAPKDVPSVDPSKKNPDAQQMAERGNPCKFPSSRVWCLDFSLARI